MFLIYNHVLRIRKEKIIYICVCVCVYIYNDPTIYHPNKDTCKSKSNSAGTRGIRQNCPEQVSVDGQAIYY